ncbi:MAG: hypothetical protein ACRD51_01560 [Candidatus Acidiferrum sp.]
MIAMLHFATLTVATIFSGAAAIAFGWMMLRVMFLLMKPATARRLPSQAQFVRGTRQLARAYTQHR